MDVSEDLKELIVSISICDTTAVPVSLLKDKKSLVERVRDWIVGLWKYEIGG